jgi:hypothetical protein
MRRASLPSSHRLFVNLTHAGDPVAVPLTGSERVRNSRQKWMVVTGGPWRAIGPRRDQRRTIRPRQRGRFPDTPPLRSWRRGSIGEQVDVEAALVGLHLDETSGVSRSRRRAHRRSQFVLDAAPQDVVLRRSQVWRRDTPGRDAGHLNLPVDVRFFANNCREGFAGLGGLPDLV